MRDELQDRFQDAASQDARYHVIRPVAPMPGESRVVSFEGEAYGSGVSFFLIDNDPGEGPELHFHPYPETWIIREGEAEFTIGTQTARASTGDVVVVPPTIPHGFKNVGTGRLEVVCIHASSRFIQQWV